MRLGVPCPHGTNLTERHLDVKPFKVSCERSGNIERFRVNEISVQIFQPVENLYERSLMRKNNNLHVHHTFFAHLVALNALVDQPTPLKFDV